MMLQFESLYWFWLLPLPLLVIWLVPPHREHVEAVRVPMFSRLSRITKALPSAGAVILQRPKVMLVLNLITWGFIVTAAAEPVWLGEPVNIQKSARDMMLVVDLSKSMEIEDSKNSDGVLVTRLAAVKSVMSEFIAKRDGDRLGLIFFGAAPYVQVPFTDDVKVVDILMQEAVAGMAGPQTMLGDAIGLTIRLFRQSEAKQRVVILLTDGNDTGSFVPPLQAAYMASTEGIVIHVIGFGDPHAADEEKLNDDVLKAIAAGTKGEYFFASDQEELRKIYSELDQLEVAEFETSTFRPKRPLYYLPLGCALFITTIFQLWAWQLARRRSA